MKDQKRLFSFILTAVALVFVSSACAQYTARDAWQRPDAIMDTLGIQAGTIVGEAGAGDGYFTFHLARRVGSSGRVYANDINRRVLSRIESRCEREGIQNITTVVGEIDDPLFPENTLDIVVMMRAFHDFTRPVEWMATVISGMKPNAYLAIIDYDPKRVGSGDSHFLRRDEILAIMGRTDFELVRVDTFLERDNIYVFKL